MIMFSYFFITFSHIVQKKYCFLFLESEICLFTLEWVHKCQAMVYVFDVLVNPKYRSLRTIMYVCRLNWHSIHIEFSSFYHVSTDSSSDVPRSKILYRKQMLPFSKEVMMEFFVRLRNHWASRTTIYLVVDGREAKGTDKYYNLWMKMNMHGTAKVLK